MSRYLVFLLLALPARAEDSVAATVNGEPIRLADVDALLTRSKPSGPLTSAQTKVLRRAVLDELIDETLLRQHLDKHAPPADPKLIDKHVEALQAAQKHQGRTLADFTRETGLTETRLRETFATMLRWSALIESRTSDADYRAYFEANRLAFNGASLRLAQIVVRVGPSATDGEVAAATEKLRALRSEILAGRITFSEAARKHSICPSATSGGDLGVIGRKDGQVEEVLAAAAFALPDGGISEPIRTPAGMHLLQVSSRKAGTATTYEQCRDRVKDAYAEEARARQVLQLRSAADVRIHLP